MARLREAASDAVRVGAAVEAMLSPDIDSDEPVRLAAGFAEVLRALHGALADYEALAKGARRTTRSLS